MKGLLQQSGKQKNKQQQARKENEGTIKQSKTHTKEEIKENIV